MQHLIIDGMLSGTGIRDAIEGGYVTPLALGVSSGFTRDLADWLGRYEDAHYDQFENRVLVEALDCEGISLSKRLMTELPEAKVEYFSSAKMEKVNLDARA